MSWEKSQTNARLRDRISIGEEVEIRDLCTYRRRHHKTTTRKITRMPRTTTSTSIIAKTCDDKAGHDDNKDHENTSAYMICGLKLCFAAGFGRYRFA